ncbi:MAG: TRAP transporter small permease subunit [Verrucomicrobiae bacterium]|nr:TRAP transporter small permease subunit [Verrucomicrobiae bacterium]
MNFIGKIESVVEGLGKAASWLLLILLGSIILQICLNYLGSSITWMEELQWHLYGISALLSLSYTMTGNGHVRVDVIHQKFSVRTKQVMETLWILFALIPLYLVTFYFGLDFSYESFLRGESSPEPGGLPYRWIVKSFISISSLLLIVTALLRAILIWSKPDLLNTTEIVHGD